MDNILSLFSVGSEVIVINPNIVQRSKIGFVEQVLDNAIIVKIGNARYALQPSDLKFTDTELQDCLEKELTLKQSNERLEKEILESQLLRQAGVFDVEAVVEESFEESFVEPMEHTIDEEPIDKQQIKIPRFDNF